MDTRSKLVLAAALVGAAAVAAWAGSRSTSTSTRPDIVVIVADDVGYADLSLHGSVDFRTPAIDSLATQGVQFTSGYVASSVCGPSRAALLTGRYPQRFGYEFNPERGQGGMIPRDVPLLQELLAPGGYHSVAVGKWHLGVPVGHRPLDRGFDAFTGILWGGRPYWPLDGAGVSRAFFRGPDQVVHEDFAYLTDELTAAAVEVIEEASAPLFLYVAYTAPHHPLQALEADLAAVPPSLQGHRRTLAAMTIALDRGVGAILAALERAGRADNTLVVFLSDNGGSRQNHADNAPLRGHKGSPYEGGHRVPFVMRWPGRIPAGATYDHPVSALDIVPTALSAADVRVPPGLDGVDLQPFVAGEAAGPPHASLFWRLGDAWAVRSGDHKLVHEAGGVAALYDVRRDRMESVDLVATHPDRAAELRRAFDGWSAEMSEPAFEGYLQSLKRRRGKLVEEPDAGGED